LEYSAINNFNYLEDKSTFNCLKLNLSKYFILNLSRLLLFSLKRQYKFINLKTFNLFPIL
jgi:hypothetical protein